MDGFRCTTCGEWHEGLPLDYAYDAPHYWSEALRPDPDSFLNSDFCVIRMEHYFVRALIEIPIIGQKDAFRWGVWGSLKKENFDRIVELWQDPALVKEPPYFSWLSNSIEGYPETLSLKANLSSRSVDSRPFLVLE